MPDPFISGQDLVSYLGRGTATDPGIVIAVDAACDAVRDLTQLTINAATDTKVLDGSGTDALLLPDLPANAAGTVTVAGGTIADYSLRDDGVLLRTAPAVWPLGRQNVAVTYDHGWADEEIPRSIRMVALALAVRIFVQGPAIQEGIGDVSVRYGVNSTDFTAGELRILDKHKPAH